MLILYVKIQNNVSIKAVQNVHLQFVFNCIFEVLMKIGDFFFSHCFIIFFILAGNLNQYQEQLLISNKV